jgi:restriction endonuclease S subunit
MNSKVAVEEIIGKVPGDWEYTTLGEICRRGGGDVQTGPFGSQLHASDYITDGIPSIMPQNIGDNRVIEEGIARIASADARRLARYLVRKGDIVYSRRGDVERRALIGQREDGWLCGTGCLRVRLGDGGVNPRFASYYLGHPNVREWIVRHAHGATMPNLNTSILSALPIVVPPLDDQRAIAHILGTLDDKIELNRRMNETLEAMARAIFKSWFVDFLPVRAKMAAKENDPSLLLPQGEPNTWFVYAIECNDGSLYIGQTEDLRQRWFQHVGGRGGDWTRRHPPVRVPYWERQPSRKAAIEREKWLKTGFGRKWLKNEIAARTQTGDPVRTKAEGRDSDLPKHFADLFPDCFEDSELGEVPAGWEVTRWGSLVSLEYGKGLTGYDGDNGEYPVYGTNGKIGSHSVPICNRPGIIIGRKGAYRGVQYCSTPFYVIDTAFYVEPKVATELRWAYYELIRQDINSMDSGSAIPSTSREDFYSLPVLSPPVGVQAAFAELLTPFWSRQEENISESRSLAAIRDTLLPKLLSGELRVQDAATKADAIA